MKVYMAVTADKYELPIAIFDSVYGLARWTGRKRKDIHSAISKGAKDQKLKCRYIKVEVNDEVGL